MNSAQQPAVSVLMAVHNQAERVGAAVESIRRQTLTDFEFVIVDDGSTDRTWETLAACAQSDPRLRLLRQAQNFGLAAALNAGLAAARGEFTARQDADDESRPERLEKQVEFLRSHPDVGVLGTAMTMVDDAGREAGRYEVAASHGPILWQMLFGRALAHPTVMFRTALVRGAGGYNPDFRYAQDLELWVRLADATRFANLDEPLVRYRTVPRQARGAKAREQEALAMRARAALASRLLGRAVPVEAMRQACRRPWTDELLSGPERRAGAALIAELLEALAASGRLRPDEAPAVRAAAAEQVAALRRGSRLATLRRLWRAAVPRPVKALAQALLR